MDPSYLSLPPDHATIVARIEHYREQLKHADIVDKLPLIARIEELSWVISAGPIVSPDWRNPE